MTAIASGGGLNAPSSQLSVLARKVMQIEQIYFCGDFSGRFA
ncbi:MULTISPECIES: hypothetical protein [unclassified Synechocystis]|nr:MULTISPECIES: hypothetical protein [unclassified Synechocystis]